MSTRVAEQHALERIVDGLEERLREPARRHHAECVAVEPAVLGGDHRLDAADAAAERPALADEGLREPGVELAATEVADAPEQVVQLVRVSRHPSERRFDVRERTGVDQVAQLLLTEQLAQELPVERQRLGAPLGCGRVVRVHVRRDVVEEQRRGHRRRGGGLDLDEVELARLQARAGSRGAPAGRRRPAGIPGTSRE